MSQPEFVNAPEDYEEDGPAAGFEFGLIIFTTIFLIVAIALVVYEASTTYNVTFGLG